MDSKYLTKCYNIFSATGSVDVKFADKTGAFVDAAKEFCQSLPYSFGGEDLVHDGICRFFGHVFQSHPIQVKCVNYMMRDLSFEPIFLHACMRSALNTDDVAYIKGLNDVQKFALIDKGINSYCYRFVALLYAEYDLCPYRHFNPETSELALESCSHEGFVLRVVRLIMEDVKVDKRQMFITLYSKNPELARYMIQSGYVPTENDIRTCELLDCIR